MREFERAAEKRRKKALKKRVKDAATIRKRAPASVSALREMRALEFVGPAFTQAWVDEANNIALPLEKLERTSVAIVSRPESAGRGWGKELRARIKMKRLALAIFLSTLSAGAGCGVAR